MKCPPNRSEQCSEECRAGKSNELLFFLSHQIISLNLPSGNTEEEIEEHIEIIHNEFLHNFESTTKNSQKPLKQKIDL